MNTKRWVWRSLFLIFTSIISISHAAAVAKLDAHLSYLMDTHRSQHTVDTVAKTFKGKAGETMVHLFIEGDIKSIPALKALGVTINTVTSSGVMTAIAPLKKVTAITKVAGVTYLEAGKSVKAFMNLGTGPDGVNLPDTGFDRLENNGKGVIVGIIDSGIDIEHQDFFDANGNSRILSIWDHTLDDSDVSNSATAPAGYSYGTQWSQAQINGGYSTCAHRDSNGHGTHVAGTVAGSGLAPGGSEERYTGVAPGASLVVVKFDFDNEKNRNTETAIIDGISWIFQQADAAGMPAVINMSLGSDYGPHDGSTSQERGINDLTGPGKIVVVAAGNAGKVYEESTTAIVGEKKGFSLFGAPIHGSGNFDTANDIVLTTDSIYTPNADKADYLFWDLWYNGNDRVRVQITTPGGNKYPSSFSGRNRNTWKTNGTSGGFDTPEGYIYVFNGSAASSWDTDNGDNNIYIEISDAGGKEPAKGQWIIELIPISGQGDYHAWHGYSSSLNTTYFWYDSGSTDHTWGDIINDTHLSDSLMTIGKPASAAQVISVGAYQTKNEWWALDSDAELGSSIQSYSTSPNDYYIPFTLHDLAFFSSRGPGRDGSLQPFISAPGVGIVAALSKTVLNNSESYYHGLKRIESGGNHATLQGTSMACPHVTGSVAILLEKAAAAAFAPTPDQIKSYISAGARRDALTGTASNNDWGHGKIDVAASLSQVPDGVSNILPVAGFTHSVSGLTATFTDTSTDSDGSVDAWSWNFGDGNVSTLQNPAHTYAASGTYSVTLTVTDNADGTDSISHSVTVEESVSGTLSIDSFSPSTVPLVNATYSVTVTGSGFKTGASLSATGGSGPAPSFSSVTVVDSQTITATMQIKDSGPNRTRIWDVIVTNPDGGSAVLENGLTVAK